MAARIKEMYLKEVAPALMKKYEYKSTMQIPKLEKIVINVGAGDAKDNSKVIDSIMTDLQTISGRSRSRPMQRNPSQTSSSARHEDRREGHSPRRAYV